MKKKIFIVLGITALLLIILLVGWGEKTTYRGGNIALQYDRRKWYLTYREEESLLAMQNEMLEMLSSITYSKQKKVWMIPDKRHSDDIVYWVWWAKQNEGKWEEPDRARDSVPDEETAKQIAEDYDKECGWTERKCQDLDYEVNAVYLEQNYIWVLVYKPK